MEDERHLPHDLFPLVLAPLARDVETLCAACCVSKGFRDAAEAHPLWRDLFARSSAAAATWRARAARRLDDAGLRALVRRAGAAADAAAAAAAAATGEDAAPLAAERPWCVDVRNFRRLTARGVIAALGARKVMWLDVGGLRTEPADAAQTLLLALRARVTLPRGGLDVDSTAICLCNTKEPLTGSRCGRLSLSSNYHCEVCEEDAQLRWRAHQLAQITATHAAQCVPRAAAASASCPAERCSACGNDICNGCLDYQEANTCSSPSCGAAFCAACRASGALRFCTIGDCMGASCRGYAWCRNCAPKKLICCRGKTCKEEWCHDGYVDNSRNANVYRCEICGLGEDAPFFCQDCAWRKNEMAGCSGSCWYATCRDCAFDASTSSDVRRDGVRFCDTWERCARRRNHSIAMPNCRHCCEQGELYACNGDGCTRLICSDECFREWRSCEACETGFFCQDCAPRYFRTADAELCNACAG
jgi:hypothetical protein